MLKQIHNCLVDDQGNIYNLDGSPKKTHVTHYGYLAFAMNGRPVLVHHIVLEAFVGKRPNNYDGCHNNGIKTDNRLVNLRWDTRKSNLLDRKKHGTDNTGDRHGRRRLNSKAVVNIRKLYTAGFSQQSIAEIYNVNQSTISRITTGSNWKEVASVV